ncbi:MAG: endonuclease/exonuclease/phosphatase family protein [Bryobacteraceae bacterium]
MMDRILQGQYAGPFNALLAKQIKVLDWNIERGLKLDGVTDVIRRERPDVCILQEVDVNTKRTGKRNLADLLASQFQFNYVFGFEFEELAQGSSTDKAFQGQATLARYRIEAPRVLRFSRQSGHWNPRWYLPAWEMFQPRRGGRMCLVSELVIGRTRLVIYNVHLESKEGDDLRLWQISEVLQDSLRYPHGTPIIIAGDMNTRVVPTPLRDYLLASGFRDACEGTHCQITRPKGDRLDWIFLRGPVESSGIKVHNDVRASDHYPLSTNLTFTR